MTATTAPKPPVSKPPVSKPPAAGGGLLIGGRSVPVEGVQIVNIHDDPRAQFGAGDGRARRDGERIKKVIWHTTKGIWPQSVTPGAGPPGKHLDVADFFRRDPDHSAAQISVGRAGEVACLCDLLLTVAFHATINNADAIGIEMYQEADGSIRQTTLSSTILVTRALCLEFGIQYQIPGRAYRRAPMARLVDGGPNVYGVLGHRDNTHRRGQGDPGDEIFRLAAADGAEPIITDNGLDLHTWAGRQRALGLSADGIPGPKTTAALAKRGFPGGIWAFGTDEQRASVMTPHQRG
jgi:hypothetical protein